MDLDTIRTRLKAKGRTQAELAAHLGIGAGHLSDLLNGKLHMRLAMFRRIEAFLTLHEAPGVREQAASFEGRPKPKLSAEERDRIIREIGELGAVLRDTKPVSDLTDDEILGYDTLPG